MATNKKPAKPAGHIQRPLEERLRIAREINEYRAAHPRALIIDAIEALGLTGKVKTAAYWTWRKLVEFDDMQRAGDRAHDDNGGKAQHFPLAVIPERAARPVAKAKPHTRAHSDEDTAIAVSLLEVAMRLLRRNGR